MNHRGVRDSLCSTRHTDILAGTVLLQTLSVEDDHTGKYLDRGFDVRRNSNVLSVVRSLCPKYFLTTFCDNLLKLEILRAQACVTKACTGNMREKIGDRREKGGFDRPSSQSLLAGRVFAIGMELSHNQPIFTNSKLDLTTKSHYQVSLWCLMVLGIFGDRHSR